MPSRATNLLFDLDGTLTNPRTGITNCIIHALQSLGHEPPIAEQLLWCIGPPLPRSFAKLLNTEDPELIQKGVAFYRERFSVVGLFENELIEGIIDALESVRGGRRLFVATSKPTVYAERIVERYGLSKYFERVHGSELSGERSDKGELIQHLLQTHGLDPADTVMIGDREHDCLGASKCRVKSIGVLWGFGDTAELQAAGAHSIVSKPLELSQLLMRGTRSGTTK